MLQTAISPHATAIDVLIRDEARKSRSGIEINRLAIEDQAAHDWYRFVLSYPPHLVRDYLRRFAVTEDMTVLDPFCGTGTTVVESKKLGVRSIGIESNIMAHFAGVTKVDWEVDTGCLLEIAGEIAAQASFVLSQEKDGMDLLELSPEVHALLLTNSISPLPLHKTLTLLKAIESRGATRYNRFFRLALAKGLVGPIGNLRFGPEVGVSVPKEDASVVDIWLQNIRSMAADLEHLRALKHTPAIIHHADARTLPLEIQASSVDVVITSPPYPNEKDYTRTTRLESVLLGFLRSKEELRTMKKGLLRSNTRNVYKGDADDEWVAHHSEIQRIAQTIETRRIELGKTSGFERLYPKVTKLYFGGMARHLASLKRILRPGAHLAYVVGDQASYLRVMIRTGQLLAQIAEDLGYEVISIDLFRTRISTVTKEQLREEVVVLRWPGEKH